MTAEVESNRLVNIIPSKGLYINELYFINIGIKHTLAYNFKEDLKFNKRK